MILPGVFHRSNASMPIMKRLRLETSVYHARLESLPFFTMLIEHRLPLESYLNQLRALSIIHGVLEGELAKTQEVAAVWNDSLRKLPLLERDLAHFQLGLASDAKELVAAALTLAGKIRLRRVERPITLIGCLYVLEGSTLGNRMHRPDMAATYQLEGANGCCYYSSYGDQVGARWREFSRSVNDLLNDPASHQAVIEAARETFSGLEQVYLALYPQKKDDAFLHITRINPEAGNHPMPQDEREIEAALKASTRGWNEFGYYFHRYGERGKRFSDSDICWLAMLSTLEPEIVRQQIDWLCKVLASRGMPTIMMEYTLRFLHEELSRAVPEKQASYQKLLHAAEYLKKTREEIIPSEALQSLNEEWEKTVGKEMSRQYCNTGKLLAAAVTDEKAGVEGSLTAVKNWLTDQQKFPAEWTNAVIATIDKAQEVAAKRIQKNNLPDAAVVHHYDGYR